MCVCVCVYVCITVYFSKTDINFMSPITIVAKQAITEMNRQVGL